MSKYSLSNSHTNRGPELAKKGLCLLQKYVSDHPKFAPNSQFNLGPSPHHAATKYQDGLASSSSCFTFLLISCQSKLTTTCTVVWGCRGRPILPTHNSHTLGFCFFDLFRCISHACIVLLLASFNMSRTFCFGGFWTLLPSSIQFACWFAEKIKTFCKMRRYSLNHKVLPFPRFCFVSLCSGVW